MRKLWIATELFYPEETSTSYILSKIANKLSDKYLIEVICGKPIYDKENNIEFKLDKKIKISRLGNGKINKNNLYLRAFNSVILSLAILTKLLFKVNKNDKVLVVTNPVPLVLMAVIAKKIKGFNLIFLVHDVFPENTISAGILKSKKSLVFSILKFFFDKTYSSADKLIVLGRDMKEVMLEKTNLAKKKPQITIIENWADVQNIYPLTKNECIENNSPLFGKTIFQYAGNIGRVNGLIEFLHIIKQIDNPNLAFVFIGNGAYKNKMKQYVKENLIKNVFFEEGYSRKDQIKILNKCDVSLVTLSKGMYGLGVPSKVYNILAAGKPILFLGNQESEIGLMIKERNIGYSFDYNNMNDLVNFLNNFNPYITEDLIDKSRTARLLAENEFSEDLILEKYLNEI